MKMISVIKNKEYMHSTVKDTVVCRTLIPLLPAAVNQNWHWHKPSTFKYQSISDTS